MLCENCGKYTATTHIKKIVNGVATTKHLCSLCANNYSLGFQSNSIANLLSSMFSDIINENRHLREKTCDKCGSTFSEIVNTGKVGCPECYTVFYNDLLPYLKRVHSSAEHIGKVPNNAPLAVVTEDRITTLRKTLHELVLKEEFEKAATIRDEIKKLESEGENNG